jgi:hypothetical protein
MWFLKRLAPLKKPNYFVLGNRKDALRASQELAGLIAKSRVLKF